MGNIWEIYDGMREIAYVTDMDTYEVVYVNQYGLERLGLASLEEARGKPCYEVLQKCASPCSICSNARLKPGQYYEWRHYNALMGRSYLIKDTMVEQDGRRYRIELAVDIGETDRHRRAIKEFTSNETMVNDALRLSLAEATPEKSIEALLKHLGQSLRSDRIYIFEGQLLHPVKNTYEWCAGGVEPQKETLQNVPFDVVTIWYDAFLKNENIIVKSLESIRLSQPKIYATLLPQQIDSLVVSPLVDNGEIIGFYGVDNPPQEFLNHISTMFMVLGHFIVSLLRRRNLVEKLARMSYCDQLTGALNRHGMNEFIAHVDHEASIGIVYCDVMGLKQVNDSQGHPAGDALIVRAYECLSQVFSPETVFRIGGDEFLAMRSDVSREEMEERLRQLRERMAEARVVFAIGAVWEERCSGRISELMKRADALMYEDKARYYEIEGLRGRRTALRMRLQRSGEHSEPPRTM